MIIIQFLFDLGDFVNVLHADVPDYVSPVVPQGVPVQTLFDEPRSGRRLDVVLV